MVLIKFMGLIMIGGRNQNSKDAFFFFLQLIFKSFRKLLDISKKHDQGRVW